MATDLWGYPDGQGGISKWYMSGDKIQDADGWHNGDPARMVAAGWLIFQETPLGVNEKYDTDLRNSVAFVDRCSYAVVPLTAEEIALAAAKQERVDEVLNNTPYAGVLPNIISNHDDVITAINGLGITQPLKNVLIDIVGLMKRNARATWAIVNNDTDFNPDGL